MIIQFEYSMSSTFGATAIVLFDPVKYLKCGDVPITQIGTSMVSKGDITVIYQLSKGGSTSIFWFNFMASFVENTMVIMQFEYFLE